MTLEARKIVNEFGRYMGVCVCEITVVMHSQTASTEPVMDMEVVRQWYGHDEDHAFSIASGFIQGVHHSEPPTFPTLVGSCSERFDIVTSPPPWEQGFMWNAERGGFTKQAEASGIIEFVEWDAENLGEYNIWLQAGDNAVGVGERK